MKEDLRVFFSYKKQQEGKRAMGLKEILKKQGYTDEQIKAILDEMAANKVHVSSVENPEETIRKLREEKAKLEEDAKQQKTAKKQAALPDTSAAEEIKKLQETVRQGQINTQLIVALTKAHASDVDYLMYQAEKTGEIRNVRIDDDGRVTGVDELVASLKKNHAGQFADPKPDAGQFVRAGIKKLESGDVSGDDAGPQTLEEAFARMYSGDEE